MSCHNIFFGKNHIDQFIRLASTSLTRLARNGRVVKKAREGFIGSVMCIAIKETIEGAKIDSETS
jgi:hypothetical protein